MTEVILSQNIYGERQVYEIKSTSHNGFSHLIIDKNSYGIIELNYESSKAHLTEYDGTYTLPKGEKYRYAATGSVGKMRFREYEGRWVLSGFYAQSKHFYELAGRQFESQSTLDFVAGRVLKKEKRNLRGLNKLATSENMMQVIQRKISPAEAKKIFNLTEKEAQSIR